MLLVLSKFSSLLFLKAENFDKLLFTTIKQNNERASYVRERVGEKVERESNYLLFEGHYYMHTFMLHLKPILSQKCSSTNNCHTKYSTCRYYAVNCVTLFFISPTATTAAAGGRDASQSQLTFHGYLQIHSSIHM